MAYILSSRCLLDYSKTLIDYFLPLLQYCQDLIDSNPLITVELNYSTTKEGRLFTELHSQLNSNQSACFTAITIAINIDLQTAYFFLQGPAGTSKTFLYYCICYYYRSYSSIVLYIASSSIAALLLPSGQTAHSRFRIPINLYKESIYSVPKNSQLAQLLRSTTLIIQDKVLIQHRYCFKAVYYILIDIRSNTQALFSSIPIILGSNFAQILPIVKRGTRANIVAAYLQQSFLQPSLHILLLYQNIRVLEGELNQRFATQVYSLSYNPTLTSRIQLPASIAQFTSLQPFFNFIYPPALLRQVYTNLYTFYSRTILTVCNNTVAAINNTILCSLNSPKSVFYSTDTIEQENNTKNTPPLELLQSFNPISLPPIQLYLKVSTLIILLQNLYPKEGLYNSTYIVITQIGRRYLKAHILSSTFTNQLQLILQIKLSSTKGELLFIIS